MADKVLVSFNGGVNDDSSVTMMTDIGHATPKPDWDDATKFTSRLKRFRARFGRVYSGKENNADFNDHCEDVEADADEWYVNTNTKYPFTVKGGCKRVKILGRVNGHGTECDVDAGNWSDQGNDWVSDWELGLVPADGRPIRIRCLQADAPRFVPGTGPYEFMFPKPGTWYHGIVVKAFLFLRRLGLFR